MIVCNSNGICQFASNAKEEFIIGFLMICWFYILSIFVYSTFKILINSNRDPLEIEIELKDDYITDSEFEDDSDFEDKKIVTIVRGVPGIGKDYYVYTKEKRENGEFAICSIDEYYYKNSGKYEFNKLDINRAERECIKAFVKALKYNISKIYLTTISSKKWEYEIYRDIAELYGYKVKLVEIECTSDEQLRYFNKRSLHEYPMSLSKKLHREWEVSENIEYIEPYYGYFLGDSLPFPKMTRQKLDEELDNYINGFSLINTEYSRKTKATSSISFISNDDIKTINKRKVNIFKD